MFYGWVLVATAFVTMGIVVNSRTAFSLFFPSILGEFGQPLPVEFEAAGAQHAVVFEQNDGVGLFERCIHRESD